MIRLDAKLQLNAKILVIDDQMPMRKLISDQLRNIGFTHVDTAINGHDAIEKIDRMNGEYDILFIDWNMPEMNGIEFIQAYKNRYTTDPAFVMLTVKREMKDVHEAMKYGVTAYIAKPVSKEVLNEKLLAVFSREKNK